MSGVATAIAASAVIGGVSANVAANKTASSQRQAIDKSTAATSQSAAQAREELFKLFPAAQQNAQAGFQGAMDVFGQTLPQQAQAVQGGNVAAQQQILAGLPQIQNAILGGRIDLSGLQPTQLQQPDFSFAQQQLPQFIDPYNPINQTTGAPALGSPGFVGPLQNTGGSNIGLGGGSLFENKFINRRNHF